ncbi:phosphosugar isomerase [Poseidonocella sp. HB161398]|uniref:phosphosugar isomerase n=1 Tax=Poseidonocella sp. HB161398 TaxID=2320855 RepID=UPI001109B3C9|nr:phosphosugar isomerase [Poseidonocella sp. HB161398]
MSFEHSSATWSEILAQPEIWRGWAEPLAREAAATRDWIAAAGIREIWLCGAGSSAFIGDVLAAGIATGPGGARIRAVATTDAVACPADYVGSGEGLLVVQFGRSGDSSESIGMLDLLDAAMPRAHRLHVTCNPTGALACRAAPDPGRLRVLRLPEATHDTGFAMTSSFTTMLLSALACLDPGFDAAAELPELADQAGTLLAALAAEPEARCPERAVFLGAGPLKGLAREAALKVLELTAGACPTQWDSPLGYRHGPKAAIAPGTLVAVMIHPDPYTARYDLDVAAELRSQYPGIAVVTLGPDGCDLEVAAGDPRAAAVLHVLAAQVWAVRWSAELGLEVDNPFSAGTLSRVVSGVTLYPWAA